MEIMRDPMALELPATAKDSESSDHDTFVYSELDTSQDGIRLVVLQPMADLDVTVRCRLVHVTFGEMPTYEALSYTWGDDVASREIQLDGKKFLVRTNLWDALKQLRLQDKDRLLWIDAVCINQSDVFERNRQLRIMPHIYNRAQIVLVWLGSTKRPKPFDDTHEVMAMCDADYWHRVWIVQEIGKARKIKIHFGSSTIGWDDFISRAGRRRRSKKDCIPVMLAEQMKDRHGDGYKLENLLRTHQSALCRDVRDKIYGFTGLAHDTYGRLAMDYGKTPFQVWQDVVKFRNTDATISQHDIFQFASFTRDLLGGTDMKTELEINGEDLEKCVEPEDDTILCPARLWGRVSCVGPTIREMCSDLSKVDQWKDSIRIHVFDQHLRNAREESDFFLELLEDIKNFDLKVHNLENQLNSIDKRDPGLGVKGMNSLSPKASHRDWSNCPFDLASKRYCRGADLSEISFVLVDVCSRDYSNATRKLKLPAGIALAPHSVREGDFICFFYQDPIAAVVRPGSETGNVIGTSVVPDVRAMAAEKKEKWGRVEPKFSVLNSASPDVDQTINIRLDFETVRYWMHWF